MPKNLDYGIGIKPTTKKPVLERKIFTTNTELKYPIVKYALVDMVNDYNCLTAAMCRIVDKDIYQSLLESRIVVWRSGRLHHGEAFLNKLID